MIQSPYAIEARALSKAFGAKIAVNGVNIQVPFGTVYGFLGPNGSGKTTTIRLLCGLLTPDSGQGSCLGYDLLSQSDSIRRHIGYMTQKFSYWHDLSVRENLEFVADIFCIPQKHQAVQACLEKFGLLERQFQMAQNLSGGWKQRLALAACTLHQPKILFLDEPTAGVDPKTRREFWDMIHSLAHAGTTILVSTHYMDEAERCHEIIYMNNGFLVIQGTPDALLCQANLTTWRVSAPDLTALKTRLKRHSAVTSLTELGHSLLISGDDPLALQKAIEPAWHDLQYTWEKASPTLEDAFIYYSTRPLSER